jgi:hypothetical protein
MVVPKSGDFCHSLSKLPLYDSRKASALAMAEIEKTLHDDLSGGSVFTILTSALHNAYQHESHRISLADCKEIAKLVIVNTASLAARQCREQVLGLLAPGEDPTAWIELTQKKNPFADLEAEAAKRAEENEILKTMRSKFVPVAVAAAQVEAAQHPASATRKRRRDPSNNEVNKVTIQFKNTLIQHAKGRPVFHHPNPTTTTTTTTARATNSTLPNNNTRAFPPEHQRKMPKDVSKQLTAQRKAASLEAARNRKTVLRREVDELLEARAHSRVVEGRKKQWTEEKSKRGGDHRKRQKLGDGEKVGRGGDEEEEDEAADEAADEDEEEDEEGMLRPEINELHGPASAAPVAAHAGEEEEEEEEEEEGEDHEEEDGEVEPKKVNGAADKSAKCTVCPECQKSYSRIQRLRDHYKRTHGPVPPELE